MTLAARLRHRVDVQRRVDSQDVAAGTIGYTWQTTHNRLPAEVLTGPGKEFHSAAQKQDQADARMTLRYFPGLRSDDRIVWRGVAYDIISIEEDVTATREYRLRCKAAANLGT